MSAEWWAVVVAAVAALFAAWQAVEARRARKDARKSANDAAAHERRALKASEDSASAAGRSATAQERIAEVAEAEATTSPWVLRKKTSTSWRLVNAGDHPLRWVSVWPQDERLSIEPVGAVGGARTAPQPIGPGESVLISFAYVEGDGPTWASLNVSWGGEDGRPVSERFTVRWKPPARLVF